jgi:hypothetical protein
MIAISKNRTPENDNYRRLAQYIADTKNDGEKVLMHWSAGSSFDDYQAGICEVEAINKTPAPNWPRPIIWWSAFVWRMTFHKPILQGPNLPLHTAFRLRRMRKNQFYT